MSDHDVAAWFCNTILLAIVLGLPSREVNQRWSAEIELNRGFAYESLGDVPHAIEAFRRAVDADANDGRPWGVLGDKYSKVRRPADAADAWERSAKLGPIDPNVPRKAADARLESGDRAAAIRDLRDNIEGRVSPEHVDDHIRLARIYADGDELDAALGELREAFACDPRVGRTAADDFAQAYQDKIADPEFWERFANIMH